MSQTPLQLTSEECQHILIEKLTLALQNQIVVNEQLKYKIQADKYNMLLMNIFIEKGIDVANISNYTVNTDTGEICHKE